LYLSSTANDISHEHKRSKVTAEDVFSALNELGFDKYEEPLREFIKNYNADKED
jgi:histone H3/H4